MTNGEKGNTMDSKKISECMKRNMQKNNITAKTLSGETGLSIERIEEFMAGDVAPRASELKLISTAIKVPLISLIHGGGPIELNMKDENGKTICRWEEY